MDLLAIWLSVFAKTPLLHCSKSERWTFHLEKGSSQIGWVLAWDGKTLLLCRQVHKRAINNLRPANYWTFSNTHGPGCFCLTNLYLKHFHLQIELNIVCTVKTDISYWPRNVFFIEILQSLLDDTFFEGQQFDIQIDFFKALDDRIFQILDLEGQLGQEESGSFENLISQANFLHMISLKINMEMCK